METSPSYLNLIALSADSPSLRSINTAEIGTKLTIQILIHIMIIHTFIISVDPRMQREENSDMSFFFRTKSDKQKQRRRRFILSIDGGGMRGIIAAEIIRRMAEMLKEKGDNRPFYSHFDLIAGTSTGSLIASALSLPAETEMLKKEEGEEIEVIEQYSERKLFRTVNRKYSKGKIILSSNPEAFTSLFIANGPAIFPQKGVSSIIGPVFTDKYSGTSYERFLKKLYGDSLLSDLLVPTLLISYSSENGIIYPIKSWNSNQFTIWEATRASSAAPLYFPPFIKDIDGERISLIDGGVAANNPSLLAYTSARELYPDSDEYHILNLSTGEVKNREHSPQIGGLTGWGGRIIGIFQSAQLEVADLALQAIPGVSYTRIWAPVLEKKIKLDETGKEAINALLRASDKIFEENRSTIEEWVSTLSSADVPDSIKLRKNGELPPPSLEV